MTRNNSVSEDLARFLNQETLTLTLVGALGRNKTYRADASESRKGEFRESLRGWLDNRVGEYGAKQVGEKRHLSNIKGLSSALSKSHGDILRDGRFHIGTAQKALNLYLKYCWARGIVREPPHCPIDSIVLDNIERCASGVRCSICTLTWTKIRGIREYVHFVEKAKARAAEKGLSLARWELEIWENATTAA